MTGCLFWVAPAAAPADLRCHHRPPPCSRAVYGAAVAKEAMHFSFQRGELTTGEDELACAVDVRLRRGEPAWLGR